MANDTAQIAIEVILDDGSVRKSFLKLESAAEASGKKAAKSLEDGFDIAKFRERANDAVKAIAAIGTAITAFTLYKAVKEASNAEAALSSFNQSLSAAGKFTQAASDSFNAYAQNLENLVGVEQEAILEGAKLLVSIGNLSGQGLQRATSAAIDLSKAIGIDQQTAFSLLSKAANGNTEALGRYGIKIDESIPKSERFAAALGLIEQKFGGAAAASAGTFSGALDRLGIAFNNIFEAIGKLITDSPVIREALNILTDLFREAAVQIGKITQADFNGVIIGVLNFASTMNTVLLPAVEIIYNVIKSLATIGQTVFDYLVYKVSGFASGIAEGLNLIGAVSDETLANMKEFTAAAGVVVTEQAKTAADAFGSIFDTSTAEGINQRIDGYIAKLSQAKQANIEFKDQVVLGNEEIKASNISVYDGFALVASGITDAASELRINASANFKALGKAMLTGFGQAAGAAFASFGAALRNGDDALAAFGDSLLKAFGSALTQLGIGFILQGIAQSIAAFGSGAPLIAAGAALAAFGGILSATGGGGVPSGAGGGAATGQDTGGGITSTPSPVTEINTDANKTPTPTVTVNVQGNILDRRSAGLELIEVLQEAFDTQGAKVIGAV